MVDTLDRILLHAEAVLCLVGCSQAPLASTQWMHITNFPHHQTVDDPRVSTVGLLEDPALWSSVGCVSPVSTCNPLKRTAVDIRPVNESNPAA